MRRPPSFRRTKQMWTSWWKRLKKCKNNNRRAKEDNVIPERGQLSGAVYNRGEQWKDIIVYTYELFMTSNPLHFDILPKTRQMEAEIIAMVLNMFHAPKEACGVTTSGGTESIIMALLAYREHGRRQRGISHPNM